MEASEAALAELEAILIGSPARTGPGAVASSAALERATGETVELVAAPAMLGHLTGEESAAAVASGGVVRNDSAVVATPAASSAEGS